MGGSSGVLLSIFFTATGQKLAEGAPLAEALARGPRPHPLLRRRRARRPHADRRARPGDRGAARRRPRRRRRAPPRPAPPPPPRCARARAGRAAYLGGSDLTGAPDAGAEAVAAVFRALAAATRSLTASELQCRGARRTPPAGRRPPHSPRPPSARTRPARARRGPPARGRRSPAASAARSRATSAPARRSSGSPGVGSVSISTRSRRRRRPVPQAVAPGDEVDRRDVGRRPPRPGRPSRHARRSPRPSAKKRPPPASGAAWCRIDPQPDCESKPLTASRAPRNSASALAPVVRPHHHRAAIPARRTARQRVVGRAHHRDPARQRPDQRQPAGLAEHQPRMRPPLDEPDLPRQRLRRLDPAVPQPVADRRPEPVGGAARLRPVVHRQRGDAPGHASGAVQIGCATGSLRRNR